MSMVVLANLGVICNMRREDISGINFITSALASVFAPTILPEKANEKERKGISSIR